MLHARQAKITAFRVTPSLPEALAPLLTIAHNLWWTWHPEAASLFRRLDRDLWRTTDHNPVALLGRIDQHKLEKAAKDQSYLHALGHVAARLESHAERASWFQQQHAALAEMAKKSDDPEAFGVAYFSAEFGLTECLQIYSGGLGVLAGDHLKSASELGIPLTGVGLLYRCGYFHQYLNADGWQQEAYPDIDYANQPVHRVVDPKTHDQMCVEVELPGRTVKVGVWRCDVGRVPLYLLDTNMPENSLEDRNITRNLYGGDVETRIKQEIILGIGGMRALTKLNICPTVFHMNEGHSAFLALERIRTLRAEHNVSFDEAREAAAAQHLFTTHTPVPAGIDRFSPDLVKKYLNDMLPELGLSPEGLLALGRENVFDQNEFFSMAVLALRTSRHCNGVSRLHGEVSRSMWGNIWPGVPAEEIPIGHVTNGVHARTWISPEMARLFDQYLGTEWLENPSDPEAWSDIEQIPSDELWDVHQEQRERLTQWCRRQIRKQLTMRGVGREEIEHSAGALDPNTFTIGFARRFATYKRATLLLRDKERLRALLTNPERPVQILIAGKSHPADGGGKELIRDIVKYAKKDGGASRVVFLEDYNMNIARRLLRGCDIWLNTPKRGLEASGTSGMKAAMNGVINVSILDGWWDEAYENDLGFAIGRGESYEGHSSEDYQDEVESRALYDLLENQILPEFYDRDRSGTPRLWVKRMKRCIETLTAMFNTNRMVAQYTRQYYMPTHEHGVKLAENSLQRARSLTAKIERYRAHWGEVGFESVTTPIGVTAPVGTQTPVTATIHLGDLSPDEVSVEVLHGEVTSLGDLVNLHRAPMTHEKDLGAGRHQFGCEFVASGSGRRGFAARVLPRDENLVHPYLPGLITWYADESVASESAGGQEDEEENHAPAQHALT